MKFNGKRQIYDVAIVGAGPCGLASGLDLSGRGLNTCIVEAGRPHKLRQCRIDQEDSCSADCDPCNVIQGFGGSNFFDGTKITYWPAGTGLLKFGTEEEIKKHYADMDALLEGFGKPMRTHPDPRIIKSIRDEFAAQNIETKFYNAQKVDIDVMHEIGDNIHSKLMGNGADIFFGEKVLGVTKKGDVFYIGTNQKEIVAKNVILAAGRSGGQFLNKLANALGIEYDKNLYTGELGVRIEMDENVFEKVNNVYNDIKLKRQIDEQNEMRSFCLNHKGIVRKYILNSRGGPIATLDGCVLGDEDTEKCYTFSTNTAINHRFSSPKQINEMYDLVRKANHSQKPLAQDMGSFMKNSNDININFDYATHTDVEAANINHYLPAQTLDYIKTMASDIDRVLPGFVDDRNIVYAPSFEFAMNRFHLGKNFETNIDGLYIGGDSAGYFRGLMQAMISGRIIANGLLQNDKSI